MEELKELKQRMEEERPTPWNELPDLALYMDQIISYMPRQLIRFDDRDSLTSAMVNNYIKDGVVPRAEGKRYNAEHLAYLTMTCVLKQVLPVKDVALLTGREMENPDVQANYDRFCAELSAALNSAADQLPDELDEDRMADTAMHCALMSYAFALSCRRMTEVLRQKQEAQNPSKKELKARRKAEKHAEKYAEKHPEEKQA